jgi:hypothetical protein
MQHRQRERRRLAGAGLGDAAQIMAFHGGADRLHLDRGGFGIALVSAGAREIGSAKAEISKIESWIHLFKTDTRQIRAAASGLRGRLDERVLTTRVMGWPLGLASEHPGLGRCLSAERRCPITHPAWASDTHGPR